MFGISHLNKDLRTCLWAVICALVMITQPGMGQAQSMPQASQVAGDVFNALGGIPGLDQLPLSNVQIESDHTSADVTLHGESVTLIGFSVDDQKMAAVIPNTFTLTTFTPIPSGTPLDDVSFSNMAFIVVSKGGAKTDVAVSGLPSQVSAALTPSGDTVNFKAGINLFGEVDVTGSTVETVLKPIGVTELKLPLNGGFPTNLFSQNPKTAAANFKNQIMDNLSLSLPLPELAIPGVPNAVSIKNAAVSITGQNNNGTRTLDVDVAGKLDVSAAGKTVAFDFDLDVIKTTGGGTDLHFTGASTPGETLSVSLAETYSVNDLNIDVKRTSGKWNWQVHGKTTFRAKDVDVSYQSNGTLLVSAKMTLADIVGSPSLPGLDDIQSNWVYILPGAVRVDMNVKGVRVDLDMYKPSGSDKYYLGVAMGDFSPTAFIPDTDNTPLQDVTFKDLAFIYKPTPTTETVALTDLPDEIQWHLQTLETRLGTNNTSFTLKQGLNVFGELDITTQGEIKSLLKEVGLPENAALPIKGTFSKQAFKDGKNASANIKNEILDNLDLHIPLPSVSIPGIPDAVDIKQTNLTIKGQNDNGTRSIEIDLKGELDLTEGSSTAAFTFDIDVDKAPGQKAKLKITADEVPGSTLSLNMVETFTLSAMSLEMDNYDSKGWKATVSARSSINGTPLVVWFNKVAGGGDYLAVSPSGLTLGKLIGADGIPGLNDLELKTVTLTSTQWSLYAQYKSGQILLQVQKVDGISKPVVTATLNTFNLSDFIPGSGSTPLKDVTFENMMALYLPGQEAKGLYTLGLPVTTESQVRATGAVTLQPGLNVFGFIDVSPSGEMKSILSEVGVTEAKLPLTGKVDKSMFHGNPTTAIKNAILDNLDLNIPLPAVSISGLPDAVTLKKTDMHIQGKNDGGTRSVDVAFKGELDLTEGSSTAAFDFDLDVDKAAGQKAKIKFTADEVPGSTLSLNMVETFTLSAMSLEMDNYDPKGWKATVSARSSINGTPLVVWFNKVAGGGDYLAVSPSGLTLGKLIGADGIPGLNDLELKTVTLTNTQWSLYAQYKSGQILLEVQKFADISKPVVTATLTSMNLTDFIPDSGSSPLRDVSFENLMAVYMPGQTSKSIYELHNEGWPLTSVSQIQKADADAVIKPGLNIFGFMDVTTSGDLKTYLSKIGITDFKIPLNGKIDKSMFHGNPTTAIKNEIMKNLDLNLALPTPSIPGLDKALTFSNAKMVVKGQLPGGTQGVSLEVSGDADVKFGSDDTLAFAFDITYERPEGGTQKELKITGDTTQAWDDPFGMDWIDLTSLDVTFDEKTQNGETDWDVSVDAKTTIGKHSDMNVTVSVTEENGALTDGTFTLDGPLDLSEVPGIQDIPEVNSFTVTSITASKHGIDAKTTYNGKQTDFFAFKYEQEWVIALEQNDFTLTEIVPPLADTPLKHIQLSEAAIVVTQAKVDGTLSDFGPVAQDAFGTIYGTGQDADVSLGQGLNLVAAFEHGKSTGAAKGGFTKMGMNQNRVVLVGDIGGILGNSNPHADLSVVLDSHGRAKNMPSWMTFADNIDFVFSIIATESGDDFDIEIGIAMDVNTKVHDDLLTFEGKLAMELEEEKADIKFVMDLKNGNVSDGGTKDHGLVCALTNTPKHKVKAGPAGWHKPFGIPGFTLYDVAMDLGLDEDGLHLGFAGGAKVGGDRFCVATDVDITDALVPQDIAFIGAADKVDFEFPENLAVQVATDLSKKAGLGISGTDIEAISTMMNGLPQPEFKNVKFAFVTPGATDPDLHIVGEGVALKGIMSWLGKDLGSIDMAVGPKVGIKVDGTIGDPKPDGTAGNLTLGPIEFKDTYLDFQVPIPPKNPLNGYFKLNADLEVPLIDIDEKIKVDVTNKNLSFSVTNTLFKDFSETIKMDLTGVDLSITHPSIKHADFAMSGALKADFGTFIETSMKATLNTAFNELNAKYANGKKKVKNAEANVNRLNKKINHERAIVRAERAKVEHKVEAAKHKVDEIEGEIHHAWHKYHHCGGWFPWPCKIRWGITIGFEKAAKAIADEVLKLVEELVKHFPIDLDPRIWPLIAAKETAMGVLKLAEYSIEGLEDLDNLLIKGLDAIEKTVGGSVNLKKASFNGSLTGVIEHDDPVDLLIDVELFGSTFEDTFAFKLENVADELANLGKEGAKDFAHLSLLGLVGVDHMFNKVLSDIPGPFKRQLRENVGNKIHTAQQALATELKQDATLFAGYSKNAQKLMKDGAVFSDDYVASLMHAPVTLLDKEPASATFTKTQFEIASSGLCLTRGAAFDTATIEEGYNACASTSATNDYETYGISHVAQELTTLPAYHASGKKKGQPNGYVYITFSSSGSSSDSCLFIDGKWQFDEVDFDGKIVEQERFHPGKDGDTPGFAWDCKTSPEYQWKILKHGEDYYQLHNRATQTCAWLQSTTDKFGDVTNALAMVPCVGANTGVFRIAKPKAAVFHQVGLPLKTAFAMLSDTNSSYGSQNYSSVDANPALSGVCLTNASPQQYGTQPSTIVSCDKPYKSDPENPNATGYDLFDYFEDDLGRRRFASRKFPNKCLVGGVSLEDGGYGWGYRTCDANSAEQWLTTTETVGGLTLVNQANSGTITDSKIRGGDKFPDPWNMYIMPLNPKAGITWSNQTSNYSGKALNKAFTPGEQSKSGITARAAEWTSIQTKLATKADDLAAGKQACVTSGKKSYCYRLGMQTGYQGKPRSTTLTVTPKPTPGQPNPVPTTKTEPLPPVELTDGTQIVVDDYALAAKNQLPTISYSTEPKWFGCRVTTTPVNDGNVFMFIPGVVVNKTACVYSEGSQKYTSSGFQVIGTGTDVFWQPAGKGYLPSSAVVTGRINIDKSDGKFDVENPKYSYLTGQTVAMYSCRAMVSRQTKVGWTIGGKYCHIVNGTAGAVTENFDVLATSYTQAAPPPPAKPKAPSCTYEMVQKYYQTYSLQGTCTKDQYNKQHPNCSFNSRQYGECGGGAPQNNSFEL